MTPKNSDFVRSTRSAESLRTCDSSTEATSTSQLESSVFPLPLTPFEYYYWCDDRAESPTTFPINLAFRGELQRPQFEQAVRTVIARHPLLHAIIDAHSSRRPQWIKAGECIHRIKWICTDTPSAKHGVDYVSLTETPGLSIQASASQTASNVFLQFHHACCDALGALQFVEELLVAYDALINELPIESRLPRLDSKKLLARGNYGRDASTPLKLRDIWIAARIWASTLFRRPTLVTGTRSTGTPPTTPAPPFQTVSLSHNEFDRLQTTARQAASGTTVNDLMLRDLFLVLQSWNAEHSGVRHQRLTINVPVSLRSRADQGMPASNSLGFWFLHRTDSACAEPAHLLTSIHSEMAAVKKWRLPLYFVGGLGIAARIPGLMRQMLRRKVSFSTAVFSNVGQIFTKTPLERMDGKLVSGNVTLDRLTGVPPIRPGTRLSIAVVTYAGETAINLRCDPQVFSNEEAADLLKRFYQRLQITGSS